MKNIILFLLFTMINVGYARMHTLELDLVFNNEVNRGFVYEWATVKSSVTDWKLQEEIGRYDMTYGTPTANGYGVIIVLRSNTKKNYWQIIRDKWDWLKDHMGETIIKAEVNYHLCDNDEPPEARTGCKWTPIFKKDLTD